MRGEVRGAPRRSWLWPSVVFVVLAVVSVSIFGLSHRVIDDQEQRLLAQEGGQVRALLSNAFDRIDSSLQVLGQVGSSSAPAADELFEETALPLVQDTTQAIGVAVLDPEAFRVLVAVGDGRPEGDVLGPDRAALMRRALAEGQLVSDLVPHFGATRLVVARPVEGSQAVAYQESAVDPTGSAPSTPDSPFRELRVAVYASSQPDPGRLVVTTSAELPLPGRVERIPFSVGGDRWLLVVGARSPRVGSFAQSVPWLLLVGGLVMSLLVTGIVRMLVRRRRYALELVDERTRELEQTHSFLENLLDIGPMVVVRGAVSDGQAVYVSPNLERLFGIDRRELETASDLWGHVHDDDAEAVRSSVERVLDGERSQETIEFRLRTGDASYQWVEGVVTGDPGGSEDDQITVYLVDTDERRLAEDARRQAQEAAESANRSKSEFLSRMSHELRTPLNAVLGFGQLLELEDLSESARDATAQILKGGRHLLGLINEVLDISRIEVGDLGLSPEAVHVSELVGESVDLVRPLAQGRGIQLVGDASGACDCYVFTDRQRAKQILLNLLSNAVKYNRSKGTVAISCERVGEARMRINVADTGPGIPAERLGMLFTPFERLGAEQTGEEGTGIGLALSKRLAEAMDGALTVESVLGQGSTFTVDLPLVEGPVERYERLGGEEGPSEEAAVLRQRRAVLHIEDNLSNLKLIERVLARRAGVEVVASMQGRLGVELAREHHPALILLDLHLPDMSGEDVLHRLRDDPATAHIPVVIVSADATPGQVRRLIAAGATDYLTKPIEVRELLRLLDDAMVTT